MKITNPYNHDVIGEVEEDTAATISRKVQQALLAQKQWQETSLGDRIAVIRRFRGLLKDQVGDLATILTSEMGKPVSQSRGEVNATLARIDFFLENTADAVSEYVVHSEKGLVEKISFEPLGIIANISAWNYPYFVGTNVFIPALLTGNAVLYKPSEFATLTGLKIAELMEKSGVPRGVFTPVLGGGSVGAQLLNENIDGVFFTGSMATGKKIAASVASRLIKLQLELGGKDPAYVCDDVDPGPAAEALADGAFYNAGQSCCSVERIYVHEKVYGAFLERFLETVRGFVMGDPMDRKTTMGPLARQVHLETLEDQVGDALSKKATLETGGKVKDMVFFEPAVLTDVDHTMKLMKEESFGPLIGIQKVQDDLQATELMNDTVYGLTAAVYSRNEARAMKILAQINSGSVYWNCCDRVSPRLPWSGRRGSGMGSTLSVLGIQAFVQPKGWHLKN